MLDTNREINDWTYLTGISDYDTGYYGSLMRTGVGYYWDISWFTKDHC